MILYIVRCSDGVNHIIHDVLQTLFNFFYQRSFEQSRITALQNSFDLKLSTWPLRQRSRMLLEKISADLEIFTWKQYHNERCTQLYFVNWKLEHTETVSTYLERSIELLYVVQETILIIISSPLQGCFRQIFRALNCSEHIFFEFIHDTHIHNVLSLASIL
jgi:hypothetical protein